MSFDYEDDSRYLCIHVILPAETSFTLYSKGDWTNDYFSLPDGDSIDYINDTVKVYSFYDQNCHHSLSELDLSCAYLNWDLGSNEYDYYCGMMTDKEGIYSKEYAIDNMKASEIMSRKKGVQISFKE
jgi:hypothetical protein